MQIYINAMAVVALVHSTSLIHVPFYDSTLFGLIKFSFSFENIDVGCSNFLIY